MRTTERFMWIKVHHVRAKIARTRNAQNGIHIGPIQINQASFRMNLIGNFSHASLKKTQCIRVGDHKDRHRLVEFGHQIFHIDKAIRCTFNGDRIKAAHPGTGRIRTVCRIGGQDLGSHIS